MKSICMQCRKEIAEHNNECECGCKRMINGDNYIFTEDNVKCKCGNCITIYMYKDEDEWFY